ncbi:hypothetical protein FMM01_02785 [Schleiferilactobacillus harbinensis]|uniref:SLAP domain-containing protein n=1 Tax=Schleiferilactobacillus harbinensis TaxID=304207 RepID=UPI00123C2466|nr:hypothetical protein [Schleiferilactobacillus harbinensis]QEU46288.1 hypothetical protein FMM01_02785 [Schleiferilactobacillus harbinensis]
MKKFKGALFVAAVFAGIAAAGQVGSIHAAAPYVGTVNYVKPYGIALWNGYGSNKAYAGRKLTAGSRWATYKAVQADDGNIYFNLGGNQYIAGNYLDLNNEYSTQAMKGVVKINYVPGYGIMIWKNAGGTGALNKYLKHGTYWRLLSRAVVNGHTWYNLGGNQWLDSKYAILMDDYTRGPKTYGQNAPTINTGDQGSSTNGNGGTGSGSGSTTGGGSSTGTNTGNTSGNQGSSTGSTTGSGSTGSDSQGGSSTTGSGSQGGSETSGTAKVEPLSVDDALYHKNPDLPAGEGGVMIMPVNSLYKYSFIAAGYMVTGKVGSTFTVKLPDKINWTFNGTNADYKPSDTGTITGTIKKTGWDSIDVPYDQINAQTLSLSTLQQWAYQTMDDYRSTHGLPALRHSSTLQNQVQQYASIGALHPYGVVVTPYQQTDIDQDTYSHFKNYFNEDWVNMFNLDAIAKVTGSGSYGVAVGFDSGTRSYEFFWMYRADQN